MQYKSRKFYRSKMNVLSETLILFLYSDDILHILQLQFLF